MRKKILFLASAVLTAAALTVPAPRAEAVTCTLRCVCGIVTCTCSDGSECTIQPPYPPIPCIYINCDGGELEP
jgi:hypothetical protein